ncbi:hypothetical protein DEU56DRAFT_915906 [Suillus clintonianus]|uniref:uncharacterized protein n=1 Tax=Suillus clintonianus TaxID=1904413 RepID=UPI001B86F26A|nr:uncharacterized protein DEU56DRAFT_915906 [Suillus clintonianus]KAG2126960.1 hypothetical protein DEU56DRAFT_915906 [Suillus clintonianus]
MIAHIDFDRVSESTSRSTSRTAKNVSRLHAHLPWGEFSSPPSSPTGIPYSDIQVDALSQPSTVLVLDPTSHGSTDPESWHKSLSAASSAVRVHTSTYPVGAISPSLRLASDEESDPDVEVAALKPLPSYQGVLCSDKESKNQRAVAIRTNTKVGQASCTATRQTCKRKIDSIDGVDAEHGGKENIPLSDAPATVKRICREKTGTDWSSVLDIVEYGEERRRQSEGTVAQAVTSVAEEDLRLSVESSTDENSRSFAYFVEGQMETAGEIGVVPVQAEIEQVGWVDQREAGPAPDA